MADFYRNIITGLDGVETTVQIIKVGTSPSPVSLAIRPVLVYDPIKDVREPIRTSKLKMQVTIRPGDDITDLFTEQAKQYEVFLKRNTLDGADQGGTETLFRGYLQNDTIQEDYVNDVYRVQLTATDGFTELKNEEYQDDTQTLPTGVAELREVIINCVNRTGFNGGVYFQANSDVDDMFPVRAFTTSNAQTQPGTPIDIFDLLVDQRVFRTSASVGENCWKVLKNVLTAINGTIYRVGDITYVLWRLAYSDPTVNGTFNFTVYDSAGVKGTNQQITSLQNIGSRVDAFDPFWANENQVLKRRASIGSAKMYWEYKNLGEANENPDFVSSGGTLSGGWTINQAGSVTVNNDDTITIGLATTAETNPAITSIATPSTYPANSKVQIEVDISTPPPTSSRPFQIKYRQRIKVILNGSSNTYTLDSAGFWTTDSRRIPMYSRSAFAQWSFTFVSDPTPEDGTLELILYPVDDDSGSDWYVQEVTHNFAKLGVTVEGDQLGQESHTSFQPVYKSPVVYEPPTVTIGPWIGTKWVGSLRLPGDVEAEFGFLSGLVPDGLVITSDHLYYVTTRDAICFESLIAKDFQGDVFGYLPYLSLVKINNFTGDYMIGGYTYDIVENTIGLELHEVFWQTVTPPPDENPWYDTLEYIMIPGDNGETIKPPVRG